MKVFFTDQTSEGIAKSYHDQHVHQLQTDIARIMSGALKLRGVHHELYSGVDTKNVFVRWANKRQANFSFLSDILEALHDEWRFRNEHDEMHKSYEEMFEVLREVDNISSLWKNYEKAFSSPPLSGNFPGDGRFDGDNCYTEVEIFYQRHYAIEETVNKFGERMNWTKRPVPLWVSYWREKEHERQHGDLDNFEPLGDKRWSENNSTLVDSDKRGIKDE